MPTLTYPQRIDQLADGTLKTIRDYLTNDIESSETVALLEDRVCGMAAKLVYLNTIRKQIALITSGDIHPTDGLHHLDAVAHMWIAAGTSDIDLRKKGSLMARYLSDRWSNWAARGPRSKERAGFLEHFGLLE